VKLLAFALSVLLLAAAPPARGARPVDVAIRTTDGTIVVRLEPARAPITVANFLHYVDARTYDGASFYRTVAKANEPNARIEVIQGGLNPAQPDPMIRPIALEPTSRTGLHNDDGAISMARTSDPNSGSTEFFICIGDDRFLDAGGPLGPGYAAFGKVVRGMDVVRRIQHAHANGETLDPPVKILSITRVR
jgi:peptidyl-prolyl cis-trans isomerase A (cyclophilin A)